MIDKIFEIKKNIDFDFRKYTYGNDPLKYLFDEWVDYYKLKFAICKAIEPKSILEIGVRYGYDAITFLNACPDASYLGIDNNSDTFGGSIGAIKWAKEITKGFNVEFLIANTQDLKEFPGDYFDLIHIDGQQDGDGTYRDLELALGKGYFILVDGYYWSKENMLSSTYFTEKYKAFIEYAIIIPGYAGELLIKTKPYAKDIFLNKYIKGYQDLKNTYDTVYYMNDCGGYDSFKRYGGKKITDGRILAANYLADPHGNDIILDIGSGRGELSYLLSKKTKKVIGLDYSESAINIATATYSNMTNLNFIQEDILKYNPDFKFDKILMTDVVEHIEDDKLYRTFEKISKLLNNNGILIIHTAPNKLNYKYAYNKKYKLAKSIGSYIPSNPRTFYEDLMHINEQTPAKLKNSLKRYFSKIFVWTTNLPDIKGNLTLIPNKTDLLNHTSIFAIATNRKDFTINTIVNLISQNKLDTHNLKVVIEVGGNELTLARAEYYTVNIKLTNLSKESFKSRLPYPVYLAYHWYNLETNSYEIFDGIRTDLQTPIEPNESKDLEMDVVAPERAGKYLLQITLVQEQQFWFENIIDNLPVVIKVEII